MSANFRGLVMSAAFAVCTALSGQASAGTLLDGHKVQLDHSFPDVGSFDFAPVDFLVGTAAPVNYLGIADFSATDTTFVINVYCDVQCDWSNSNFNGFDLVDFYGVAAPFTGASINAATSYAGFDASRLTFTANSVSVDLNGLTANGTIKIDIAGGGGAVPEPATWSLMIGGFGGLGAVLRRRRASSALATA